MGERCETTAAGPTINGTRTRTTLYTPAQFREFPHLEQLKEVINASFIAADADFFRMDRLSSKEQYLEIIGDDTFTYTVLSEPSHGVAEPTIYAVGSAHLYAGRHDGAKTQDIWHYVQAPGADLTGVEQWELKILAVNAAVHRQGLGKHVLGLLEGEIRRRFELGQGQGLAQGKGPTRCQLVLSTVEEVNYSFYNRHGYAVDSSLLVEKGQVGNWAAFHVVSMSKVLP